MCDSALGPARAGDFFTQDKYGLTFSEGVSLFLSDREVRIFVCVEEHLFICPKEREIGTLEQR